MGAGAWLRFAELSLLAGWLAWRIFRRSGVRPVETALLVLVAGVSVAQLGLAAAQTTDALTPLSETLPQLLTSAYGALSAAVFVAGLGLAIWGLRAAGRGARALTGGMLALLVLAGAGASLAQPTVSAIASSGEMAMSPTLEVPRSALNIPNPEANDPASVQRGKAIFEQYCASCHGVTGDGRGPAGANLRIQPPTFHNPQHFLAPGMDGAHFWVIQHGDGNPGGMPAWQGTLTDEQIWDVLNYVKTIAAGTNTSG